MTIITIIIELILLIENIFYSYKVSRMKTYLRAVENKDCGSCRFHRTPWCPSHEQCEGTPHHPIYQAAGEKLYYNRLHEKKDRKE